MTQIATVEKDLGGGYAEVSVPRKSACGHDCEECAGCGMTGAAIKARARNDIGAQPGDKVVVESSTKKIFGVVALVALTPLIAIQIMGLVYQYKQNRLLAGLAGEEILVLEEDLDADEIIELEDEL